MVGDDPRTTTASGREARTDPSEQEARNRGEIPEYPGIGIRIKMYWNMHACDMPLEYAGPSPSAGAYRNIHLELEEARGPEDWTTT